MPGFAYSPALQSFGQNLGKPWTPEEMDTFLTQPALRVPGTAMAFAGLKKPEQRAAVICYIEQTAR